MSTVLFFHRYYELIRTAADTRLVDSPSDQQTELEDLSHVRHRASRLARLVGSCQILPEIERFH